jgi:hypothetical protein
MRSIPLILAAFVASGPAAAQCWEEYSYPDYAFSVAFPANPQVQNTTYQIADNRSVPARVYMVRQNNSVFMVTVADLANTGDRRRASAASARKLGSPREADQRG